MKNVMEEVQGADKRAPSKKRMIAVLLALALAIALCWVVGAFCIAVGDSKYPIEQIYIDFLDFSEAQPLDAEVVAVKTWEERTITEQYNTLVYQDVEYNSAALQVAAVDVYLGSYTVYGVDWVAAEDTQYEQTAKVYTLPDINPTCAVAVLLEDAYYLYRNTWYQPATLGDFVTDLNLYENLFFGAIYMKDGNSDITLNAPDAQQVFALFEDVNVEAVENYDAMIFAFIPILSISVDLPILGYQNVTLDICENGYVTTNLLGTGKGFYVGEEKTQAFLSYAQSELEGTRRVFITKEMFFPFDGFARFEASASQVQSVLVS